MTADELWWQRVPAAEKLVKFTRDRILNCHSVQIFPDMAWKDTFLALTLEKVRTFDAGIVEYQFDGEAMEQDLSLVDIIAEQLGFGFNFDGSLKTLLGHLETHDNHIWKMRRFSPARIKEAHRLIRELAQSKAPVCVILEDGTQTPVKSLYQIKLSPTQMDIRYFAWTLLLEEENVPLLEYAAVLCEQLSGGDPERCALLCTQIHALMHNAGDVCTWLSSSQMLQAVHLAQLRGIQPVIEVQRLRLIDSLGERLKKILPFTDERNGQFTKPQEVELRHLIYHKRELSLSPAEETLLDLLYAARNDLSHLKTLSEKAIADLDAAAGK